MNPATTGWRCDECGDWILDPKRGWVEWLVERQFGDDRSRGRRMRITYEARDRFRARCRYQKGVSPVGADDGIRDYRISELQGPDGLK